MDQVLSSKRKLAAILSADVVGYSRLMGDDERATVDTLKTYRAAIGQAVQRHHGRVVNAPGDALLAEFPSAVEAVQAAVEIQRDLKERNALLPPERQMRYRIGVNIGDVIEEGDGTLYGDGVNVAARLESVAEADGVCVSGKVFEEVEGKVDVGFDFAGEQEVKNIAKPVRVYHLRTDGQMRTRSARARPILGGRRVRLIAAAVVIVLIGGVAGWEALRGRLPATDPVLALPSGPSIAVLPFANLSGDPAQDYFADGMTEEIITQLTRFRELFVLARNTTFQYRGKAVDIKKLGRDLGVRYVLEGSIRKAADSVRVSAQLLDATSGTHLWAETFDRPLTAANLFAVQDEITGYVVAQIADAYGVIARARFTQSSRQQTDSLDAYDCVLHANLETVVSDPRVHLRARDCLERATTLEPSFAEGWAWLSLMYLYEYLFGLNPRSGSPLERALQAAQRAVAVDPASQMAHYALAVTHYHRREHEQFVTEAEQALALNPNNTLVLAEVGYRFTQSGQLERGVALTRKAMRLNPRHPPWYHVAPMPFVPKDRES